MKNKAFTLVELLVSIGLTLILMIALYNFYNLSKLVYATGISGQMLQDGVNTVLGRIIEGKTEPGGVFRLEEGVSYHLVSISELHFWGTDSKERWYRLNNTATSLIYHHPTASGTQDEVIYTAPTGVALTLRFWIPAVANYTAAVIGIDVSLTQNVFGKTITGSSTTMVNLRNHP